jgi:hypothetical protein
MARPHRPVGPRVLLTARGMLTARAAARTVPPRKLEDAFIRRS